MNTREMYDDVLERAHQLSVEEKNHLIEAHDLLNRFGKMGLIDEKVKALEDRRSQTVSIKLLSRRLPSRRRLQRELPD